MPRSALSIRTVSPADVRRLWARGFPDDEWPGDHHTYWIAWDGRAPAGFCSAVVLADDPATVFFSSSAVFPSWRGIGLHRRMIAVRRRWARRRGARCLITYVKAFNRPSAANLVRAGFHWYNPAVRWAGDYRTTWYFMRDA